MPVKDTIQSRRGSTAQWSAANPILADGEIGYDSTTKQFKVGDGSTAWVSLAYSDISATNLTTGTLPDARLSPKVKSLADLATPASTSLLAMNGSGAVVDGTYAKSKPIADATTPGIVVLQDADVATIMQSFEPNRFGDTIGTDPVIGRWNWAINTPTDFPGSGTRGNRICGFGYNISKHGGGSPTAQELAGDASFGTTFEDFYDVAGTQRLFEWYIQTVPAGADPGANQLRPLMVIASYPTLASNTTPQSGVSLVVDETIGFTVDIKHAGGVDTWQWGEATSGGLDTQCLVSAGSGIVFANNSRSIKALNSAGSPRDLIWMRSDNVVVVSQGDPVYISQILADTLFVGDMLVGRGGQTSVATNTGVGYLSLNSASLTGTENTTTGYESLKALTTGSFNTAFGARALLSATTGGANNAVGNSALRLTTAGDNNNAVGQGAMYFNTTGSGNTAVGTAALQSSTTGNENTAIGYYSHWKNTTGLHNVAIGATALSVATTGNYNTCIGVNAGDAITTGSTNLAIGYDVDVDSATANNQINIANRYYHNRMRLQESSDPAAPAADNAIIFCRDNGSGKTQVCVRFATGAIQVLATEP